MNLNVESISRSERVLALNFRITRRANLTNLAAVTQQMIHQHQGKHRLGDWRGANANAGIVTACSYYLISLPFDIDRLAGQTNARCRLQCNAREDILTARYTTENSSGIIALEAFWRNLVAMLAAFLSYGFETRPDLYTLNSVNAHQSLSDIGI